MNTKKNVCSLLIIISVLVFGGCAAKEKQAQFTEPPKAQNLFDIEGGLASAGMLQINMSARKLKTIDLDQMNDRIMQYISAYRQTQDSANLYKALTLSFCRPDEDSVREKVLSLLKAPIDENSEWQIFITRLAMQAINTLNESSVTADAQMTAGVVLENILEEMLPDYRLQKSTGGFESNIIYSIAVTKMNYSEKAMQERKLALMKVMQTPNLIARQILSR